MKGIDFAIKKTAMTLNLPEDQVKIVINEYWNEISRRLVKLESTTISVRHVGNFTISKYKLDNFIKKSIKKIRRVKASEKLSDEKRNEILIDEYDKLKMEIRLLKH